MSGDHKAAAMALGGYGQILDCLGTCSPYDSMLWEKFNACTVYSSVVCVLLLIQVHFPDMPLCLFSLHFIMFFSISDATPIYSAWHRLGSSCFLILIDVTDLADAATPPIGKAPTLTSS